MYTIDWNFRPIREFLHSASFFLLLVSFYLYPLLSHLLDIAIKSTLNNENIGLFVLCTETSFPLTNCDKSSHVDRRIQIQQKVVFCLKQVMLVDGRTSPISFKYCLLKGICNGFFSHISVNTFWENFVNSMNLWHAFTRFFFILELHRRKPIRTYHFSLKRFESNKTVFSRLFAF